MKHIHVGDSRFRYRTHPFPALHYPEQDGSRSIVLPLSHIEPVAGYTVRVKEPYTNEILSQVKTRVEAETACAEYNDRAECSSAEIVETHTLPEGEFSIYSHNGQYIVVQVPDTTNRALACIGYSEANCCLIQSVEETNSQALMLMCHANQASTSARLDFIALFNVGQSMIFQGISTEKAIRTTVAYTWTGECMTVDRMNENELSTFLMLKKLKKGDIPESSIRL